jgi:hypothetical protein
MVKRQLLPQHERSSESCLHCEINEVVREHIEGQENVDIADLAARMVESVVDLILLASSGRRARKPTGRNNCAWSQNSSGA